MIATLRRILYEHRVRLPLILAFALGWGYLIVFFYAHADVTTQTNFGPAQVRTALRIFGGNWLAIWVGLGAGHPLLLAVASVLGTGTAVRSVAGELEGGTLELVLSRPLARLRHLGAYIVFLLATLSLTAIAYTLGSWLAWQTEHPSPGTLSAESLSLVAVYTSLLFLAIGGIGLACSACVRERGKALGLALGLTIGMYAWNFLASLSTTLAPSTVVSLWHWFNPAPVAGGAGLPVADIAVLGGVAAVSTAAAVLQFLRRDL